MTAVFRCESCEPANCALSGCALSGGKLSLLKCVSAAAPVQRQRTQGRESNGEGAQDTKRQMRLRLAACLSVVAGSVSSPVSKFRVEGGIRRHVVDMYGGGGHVPPLCRDVSQRDVEGHPLLQEGLCHSSCNTVCHWLEVLSRIVDRCRGRGPLCPLCPSGPVQASAAVFLPVSSKQGLRDQHRRCGGRSPRCPKSARLVPACLCALWCARTGCSLSVDAFEPRIP